MKLGAAQNFGGWFVGKPVLDGSIKMPLFAGLMIVTDTQTDRQTVLLRPQQ